MDEVARLEARHLRHHLEEQSVGGDVERNAQEDIRAALVELEAQSAIRHVELEEGVARRQVHPFEVRHVPSADDDTARVRVLLEGPYHLRYLVDMPAVIVRPGAPLVSVDMSEVTVRVRPFVPDTHTMLLQVLHVRVALQEPEQFIDDGFQVKLLRREQGKTLLQIEAHLMSENADSTRTCAVALLRALVQHTLQKIQILFHASSVNQFEDKGKKIYYLAIYYLLFSWRREAGGGLVGRCEYLLFSYLRFTIEAGRRRGLFCLLDP